MTALPTIPTAAPLTATLADVALQCGGEVAATAGCGVVLLTADGRRITSVGTDPISERLNALYDLCRDNPCAAAYFANDAVLADRSAAARRWPTWTAMTRELGVGSVLAAPLRTADRSLGALMVYSRRSGAFRPADANSLAAAARSAATVIDERQRIRTVPAGR